MLTENSGFCESLAHPSSETACCCPYMDRSSDITYIYTYIYIYIYMDINIHSYHSSNDILWFHPQYPMLLCFYSWFMLLCCYYSGHKTRYDRCNNIHSEPSPAPTPPTRAESRGSGAAVNRDFKSRPPAQESQTISDHLTED